MARNPKTETILEAWWELDHCEAAGRAESEVALNQLLDVIVLESQGQCNRDQILDHLFSSYKEYRSEKRKKAQVQIAQVVIKK